MQFASLSGGSAYRVLVDRGKLISDLNAGSSARSAEFDSIGGESALMLDPPYSIVWNLELTLSLEVITGINHGSGG
jgi:hypothetical protein